MIDSTPRSVTNSAEYSAYLESRLLEKADPHILKCFYLFILTTGRNKNTDSSLFQVLTIKINLEDPPFNEGLLWQNTLSLSMRRNQVILDNSN